MISQPEVRRRLAGWPPEALAASLAPALRGEAVMPGAGGSQEEPPEDYFAQLLLDPDTPSERRRAIVAAIRQVYADLTAEIEAHGQPSDRAAFLRLCRLVTIAKPPELADQATALPPLLIALRDHDPEIFGTAASAAIFFLPPDERTRWRESLADYPATAARAFQDLLQVNPARETIVEELVRLWERRTTEPERWKVDAPLLTLQAAHHREDAALIGDVLDRLRARRPDLVFQIEAEIKRRPSTRAWLAW